MDASVHMHVRGSDGFDHRVSTLPELPPYAALTLNARDNRGGYVVLFVEDLDVLTSLIETAQAARAELAEVLANRPAPSTGDGGGAA